MGLYIVRKDTALKLRRRYGDKPLFIYGSLEETIDVNNPEDLEYANTFAKGLKAQENNKFRLLKHFVTSPVLSDIIDDLNFEMKAKTGAVINNFICNMPQAKILGRANTIKLRKLYDGEDFKGIYNSLAQYESITDNDVIVVENEIKDYAYFGDLNGRLAIRSGACATIIDGATRDINALTNLNYPVFSNNYNAADVRRRATLDYINKPITIKGQTVNPGDLIFADGCSVVVIYKQYEDEILKRALQSVNTEKNIISDIFGNKNVEKIVDDNGAF